VSDLEDVLSRARARLASAEDGHLAMDAREEVWAALGPCEAEPGHRRRADLAIRSCEQVLGIWDASRPGDRNPHAALDAARSVLRGEAEPEQARAQAGKLWGHAENVSQLGDPSVASVGFGCAKAVGVALHDEHFDPERRDPHRRDRDRDAFEVDAAFMAALAAAGGPPWGSASNPDARRAFWTWWLGAAREVGADADARGD
jgi:hypothetical protein